MLWEDEPLSGYQFAGFSVRVLLFVEYRELGALLRIEGCKRGGCLYEGGVIHFGGGWVAEMAGDNVVGLQ